jgi:hypothetical protein
MFEIWTKASLPYEDMLNNQQVWVQVVAGYRLPCPLNCPKAAHDIMMECWRSDPKERPLAGDVAKKIRLMQSLCPQDDNQDAQASSAHNSTGVNSGGSNPKTSPWNTGTSSVTKTAANQHNNDSTLFASADLDAVPTLHGSLHHDRPTSFPESDTIFTSRTPVPSRYQKLTITPSTNSVRADLPLLTFTAPTATTANDPFAVTINRLSSNADKHHYVGVNRSGEIESEI